MLYLTCTTITSVDLAHYGVCRAKDWVSVDCGTKHFTSVAVKIYIDGSKECAEATKNKNRFDCVYV